MQNKKNGLNFNDDVMIVKIFYSGYGRLNIHINMQGNIKKISA